MYEDKTWTTRTNIAEKDLQMEVARFLRARELDVSEGAKLHGGEYDLVVNQSALIENKVAGPTADPFESKPSAPLQANRYAVAKCKRIFFTVIGYNPKEPAALMEQTRSIKVRQLGIKDRSAAEICFVVPYGLPTPSTTKK
jgi:hypothetical protein